jgi:hypothetical protein
VAATDQPPKREIGSGTANSARVYWPGQGVPGWSAFTAGEHVPDLKGHRELPTFDEMLTNPQLWALFIGMLLPLMDYDYGIEQGDADADYTAAMAADLGLPVGLPDPGETAPQLEPGAYRFDFLGHLWEALFMCAYGRYWFEQVAEYADPADGGDGLTHLKRLAPRPPHYVSDTITDDDGGLVGIMFPGKVRSPNGMMAMRDVLIPADQLVGYVLMPTSMRRWVGRSMLRPCYEPWVLRGKAVRIDIINHEKAGGVPGVETDETWQGQSLDEMRDLASQFNVGEESGWALPPGAHLKIARMGGTDVIASARYHDEVMARAWGEMVRQIVGASNGSRALADPMQDMEAVIRRALIRQFAGTFREHVIEDWWGWNVPLVNGKRPPHPQLAWRPRDDGKLPSDPELGTGEQPPNPPVARAASPLGRHGVVSRATSSKEAPASRSGRAAVNGGLRAAASLPDRPLRREPTDAEIRAAVDFASMDVAYEHNVSATERLLGKWLPDLHSAAEDAITSTKAGTERKRLTRLNASQITLPAPDPAELRPILVDAARAGADAAESELRAQGLEVVGPTDVELELAVSDQAAAVAQQVADGVRLAASRRAVQVNAGRSIADVAAATRSYLDGLAHAWERDQLRGAVQAAYNAGRLLVFSEVPASEPTSWIASELLDAVTCGPCREVDGRDFGSLSEAQRFYPFGGFMDCLGGPRCRGTVVGRC